MFLRAPFSFFNKLQFGLIQAKSLIKTMIMRYIFSYNFIFCSFVLYYIYFLIDGFIFTKGITEK